MIKIRESSEKEFKETHKGFADAMEHPEEAKYCMKCDGMRIFKDNNDKEKKTLSDKIIWGNSPSDCRYNELDIKESIMDFFVWVTTEHAPGLSSATVAQKMKEIFGERLIK